MSTPKHAQLSASGSHRWMMCPASIAEAQGIPDESSSYAQEGTQAHDMAERLIKAILESKAELGEVIKALKDENEEMFTYVNQYVSELELIGSKSLDNYDFVECEVRLPLYSITGELGAHGTADCLIIDGRTLHVCDLKYGLGVPVDAVMNTQLLIYAEAARQYLSPLFDIDAVTVHIMQPRLNAVSEWTLDAGAETLLVELKRKAERARFLLANPDKVEPADYCVAEDVCRFCKAKATCRAVRAELEATVTEAFAVLPKEAPAPAKAEQSKGKKKDEPAIVIPTPDTPEGLAKACSLLPVLRSWADAVEEKAYALASSGTKLPGFKLVAGRAGVRKWKDEDAVEEFLTRQCFDPWTMYDLKSPAKLEKALKQCNASHVYTELEPYITRTDSKPRLVPETDKAPELPSAAADFEVLDAGQTP